MVSNKFIVSIALPVIWVAMGIIGTMWFNDLTFVTATYVVVQIVTTIGYGDISVNDDMRWFMTFYVIFGLCVAANAINDIFNALLNKSQAKLTMRMNELEESIYSNGRKQNAIQGAHHELSECFAALAIFSAFVLVGAVFYAWVEPCSCSYGKSHIEDCVDGELCASTGGATKTLNQAVYMAVITLTTVGFGDLSPKSEAGRIFGIFWMIAGVLAFANFVTTFGAWIDAAFKKDHSSSAGREIFDRIDRDQNGIITRGEFMSWILVKEGIVPIDQIDHFNGVFEALAKEDGEPTECGLPKVDFKTLERHFHFQEGREGRWSLSMS